MKTFEIRLSLLEVTSDKDGNSKHTKHVAFEITDAAATAAIAKALESALEEEQDAIGIKSDDQFTLDNCEDGAKFHLTGKENLSDEEKKQFTARLPKKKPVAA